VVDISVGAISSEPVNGADAWTWALGSRRSTLQLATLWALATAAAGTGLWQSCRRERHVAPRFLPRHSQLYNIPLAAKAIDYMES